MTEPKTRPYQPDDSDTAPVEEAHTRAALPALSEPTEVALKAEYDAGWKAGYDAACEFAQTNVPPAMWCTWCLRDVTACPHYDRPHYDPDAQPKVCPECGEDCPRRFRRSGKGLCRLCEPLNPRWFDYRWRVDAWLVNKTRPLFRGRLRGGWLHRMQAGYALRFLHCKWDGQCVFYTGHRGSCYGGDGDE